MATIRDVARIAGVSISTVSLSLNDPARVSPKTARRVEDAVRQVGYVANPIARSLKSGRSRLIGLVVSDVTNPFFGSLLREIERHATAQGYLVVVSDTADRRAAEEAILAHLSGLMVAGIILSPCVADPGLAPHVTRLSMPVVQFDQKLADVESDFVGTDNVLAASMVTAHLAHLGHRRIAHVGGTRGHHTAEGRRQGFMAAMEAAGLPVENGFVVDGRYAEDEAYQQAMRLLTRADRPTAIVAASNVMAVGALRACNDLGLACPQDISLTGIDDLPWSGVFSPRITVAVQPVEEMARAASRLLMDRIGAPLGASARFTNAVFAPRLIVGNSTRRLG
jgi:LacI family transcriptional regulator